MNTPIKKPQPKGVDFSNVSSDLLKMLAEIGFLGISRGFSAPPKDIFNGIIAVRPDDPHALTGKAVADVLLGNQADGTQELLALIKQDPKNDVAKSFLAVAYFMQRNFTELAKVVKNLVESGKDANAITMAKGLLEKAQEMKK
jgi:predicted Zn-dependent protease